MKVFTHEPSEDKKVTGETVIILDKVEGQRLVNMLEFAASKNKRKKTWAAIAKEFTQRLCCF
ncbi:hypothetical protein KAR91_48945 [Candidatus Pacearchaeota archaeon]|nr:hypothetical protein [Candidatus Pacearchaeota archaeon]